jgi:hypothetical protein
MPNDNHMPNDNPSRPPSAQPWSPPEPGVLLNMMLEVPGTLALLWQQVLAGAPAPMAAWDAQKKQAGARPGAPWEGLFQVQAPTNRGEPPPPPFSPSEARKTDFWTRALRSFRFGLTAPLKER